MKKFLLRAVVNMAGIYIAGLLFPAIGAAGPEAIFLAGLVLALINLLIRPLLLLIALPINIITLGFFTLVINAWMVMLAAYLTGGVTMPSFLLALATAFIIAVGNLAVDAIAGR